MIGIDTNVLLRALLDDDPATTPARWGHQGRSASEGPILINPIVLAEAAWT